MSKLYNKYFASKDFYKGMAGVMFDIRKNTLSEHEVKNLAEELLEKKLIKEFSSFEHKEKSDWNEEYIFYLMNGMGAGKLSQEYLVYYSEVSRYVRKKGRTIKLAAGLGITILIIVVTIIFMDK